MIDRRQDDRRLSDRRIEPRRSSPARLRILRSGSSSQVLAGELLDVSPGGLRLRLTDEVVLDETLLVEARDARNRCCNLTAVVRRTHRTADGRCEAGCALRVELTPKQLAILSEFSTATAR